MDVLRSMMPAIAVITITVSAFIKRKDIKGMFSDRPVFNSVLVLIGIVIILLLGFNAARFIMKI